MGEKYHDLATPKDNHVHYGLSFPNQYAMETWQNEVEGQVPEDRHLGKAVRVLDTNRVFMFVQRDPELIFVPIDAPATIVEDLDLYIDGTAGDDLTGDGSSGAPYKTFTRAFQVLENKELGARVKMRPAAGVYDEFPENIEYTPLLTGGQIVIDASGETYPEVAGPFTIDTVTGVGPQNLFGFHEATDLKVTGSPAWTPDQFYGKFIHVTSGAYSNKILNIWSNTADTVRVMLDLYTFSPGDTFNVVDCPVKIEVDHPIRFTGRKGGEQQTNFLEPQLVIAGVEFEVDTGTTDTSPMSISLTSAVFTYSKLVDMWAADNYSVCLTLNAAGLNLDFLEADTLDNTALEDWFNYSFQIQSLARTSPTEIGIDAVMYNTNYAGWFGGTFCRRYVFAAGNSGYISTSFVGGIATFFGPNNVSPIATGLLVSIVYVEQVDYNAVALVISGANFSIIEAYIAKCGQPIDIGFNSYLHLDWLKADNTKINATYAALVRSASSIHIPVGANVDVLGTSGAIEWDFDGATVAAWPTAGNFVQKVDSFVSTKG